MTLSRMTQAVLVWNSSSSLMARRDAGRGQIADPIAELDQPGHDRAGHRVALQQRGRDRQRVEEVDVEPTLAPPYPPGAQRDRIGVPQHQRHVDRGHQRIGAERHHQRQGRQPKRIAAPNRGARGWRRRRRWAGRDRGAFFAGRPGARSSSRLITESRPSVARKTPSKLGSYSMIRQPQAKFSRALLRPCCVCNQESAASASFRLRHKDGRCRRMRPEMK